MNHYEWLEKNLPIFFERMGIDPKLAPGEIRANGDKGYSYKWIFEKNGLHFFHGMAIYLLSYFPPWSNEVRETKNGWVPVDTWIVENKERFLPFLPPVE